MDAFRVCGDLLCMEKLSGHRLTASSDGSMVRLERNGHSLDEVLNLVELVVLKGDYAWQRPKSPIHRERVPSNIAASGVDLRVINNLYQIHNNQVAHKNATQGFASFCSTFHGSYGCNVPNETDARFLAAKVDFPWTKLIFLMAF